MWTCSHLLLYVDLRCCHCGCEICSVQQSVFICCIFTKYMLWKNVGKEEHLYSLTHRGWQMSKKSTDVQLVQTTSRTLRTVLMSQISFLLKISLGVFSMILKWDVRVLSGDKIIAKAQKWVACKSWGWQQCWPCSLINMVLYAENLCLKYRCGTVNYYCMCWGCFWSIFYKAVSYVRMEMILVIVAPTLFTLPRASCLFFCSLNMRTGLWGTFSGCWGHQEKCDCLFTLSLRCLQSLFCAAFKKFKKCIAGKEIILKENKTVFLFHMFLFLQTQVSDLYCLTLCNACVMAAMLRNMTKIFPISV